MKRSTKTAPVSLSNSYLIGSPRIGISMITLQSFGTFLPAGTRSRLMARGDLAGRYDYTERAGSPAARTPKPRHGASNVRASGAGVRIKVVFAILGILPAVAIAVALAWFYLLS